MDFDEPAGRPESATVEHLVDSTFGGIRSSKHRRLAHAACNRARNEFRMQAERQFEQWIDDRRASAKTLTDK